MSQPPVTHHEFTRAFRDTLGMFATGIAVVCTRAADGDPIGLTVNSFNSPGSCHGLRNPQADRCPQGCPRGMTENETGCHPVALHAGRTLRRPA